MWDAFQACPDFLQARSEPDPPALAGRTGRVRKQVRASLEKGTRYLLRAIRMCQKLSFQRRRPYSTPAGIVPLLMRQACSKVLLGDIGHDEFLTHLLACQSFRAIWQSVHIKGCAMTCTQLLPALCRRCPTRLRPPHRLNSWQRRTARSLHTRRSARPSRSGE